MSNKTYKNKSHHNKTLKKYPTIYAREHIKSIESKNGIPINKINITKTLKNNRLKIKGIIIKDKKQHRINKSKKVKFLPNLLSPPNTAKYSIQYPKGILTNNNKK